ncbi:Helix-turn-helix domain-containing protein [Paenacidovorax caeni]|uniref:Helix-turn-helix domain-containing protein n=2 Tax=Paenacidovorax caeni TaxID=343013 RepID=A0A1I7JKI0_9BURK|nr:Helix-turn-helix domain-containing protein [Paenacidovorax caeni]
MPIGERLREERERLGLSQPKFAELAGTTKQTLFSWESGRTAPDGFQMAAFSAAGVDVLYVLTGERSGAHPAHDAAEQVLLDSYRRCSAQARQHLIQTAALLAAGLPPAPAKKSAAAAGSGGGQSVVGDNAIQIGSVTGKARIKSK